MQDKKKKRNQLQREHKNQFLIMTVLATVLCFAQYTIRLRCRVKTKVLESLSVYIFCEVLFIDIV